MSVDIICNKNIVKNERNIININNIIKDDKLTNSYIIEGIEGSGKTLLAKYFAKALLCENFTDDTCNECNNCLNFEKNNLTDVFYIKPKKTALSIDETRKEIIDAVNILPSTLKYKIFIIDADEITVQAQNALLKTIEQPPDYAVFIFTTSNINMFLSTVLSRCTVFKTQYIGAKDIFDYLKSCNIDEKNIAMATNIETGSIGQAINIAKSETFETLRSDALKYIKNVNTSDVMGCVSMAKSCEQYKTKIFDFFNILKIIYRDLFVYKSTQNINLIFQQDIKDEIIAISENIEVLKLSENFDYIDQAIYQQKISNSYLLNLETLFLKLSCNI